MAKAAKIEVFQQKYKKVKNIGITDVEIVVLGEGSWKHYILAPDASITIPQSYGSSILDELVRRKQISIKEVVK